METNKLIDIKVAKFSYKARKKISQALSVAKRGIKGSIDPDFPEPESVRIRKKLNEYIDGTADEVNIRKHILEIGAIYSSLSKPGKINFLKMLCKYFSVDHHQLDIIISKWDYKLLADLQEAVEPAYNKIFRYLASLPDGLDLLINMRAIILENRFSYPELEEIERNLYKLFTTWFDIGLLDLEPITWDSPARVLEKLIQYEAVQMISSWDSFQARLESDHILCYAFFHHKIFQDPLVFIEALLTDTIPSHIDQIVNYDSNLPLKKADHAIFYSICATKPGLKGTSLSKYIIKFIINKIIEEYQHIKFFYTFSPINNYRPWLLRELEQGRINLLRGHLSILADLGLTNSEEAPIFLANLLKNNWYDHREALKPILLYFCAYYLLNQKNNNQSLDSIANFHLSNGANIERINWLADESAEAMENSFGMTVNYNYKLAQLDENQYLYNFISLIVASTEVKDILHKYS